MDIDKLNRWAEKLLDTGKTNNLIKFKDTKASSVEVIVPDAASLFSKIDGTASLEVYDPKLQEDDDIENPVDEESEVKTMSKEAYKQQYAGKLRKVNQILLYNHALIPLTALKNIDKKAKTVIEETGVNVAYMAFGFINWKEKDYSDIVMNAPILLAPVIFEKESQITPYYIKSTADEIIVNPTFSYYLQAEFDVKMPEYSDEDDFESYMSKVEAVVRKLGWTVSRECKIGVFSFLKINMYRDLKDNKDEILKNKNVRMLLGEPVEFDNAIEYGESIGETKKTENPIIDLHNVVDADSSQIEAIEMAKSGRSFVLQGPPGTGKSQTITNIISECLHDGKKVLFVSEKQAALNVVYDKLKKAGLSEFCLELHSHKANKKAVIEDLCHTLRASKTDVSTRAGEEISEKKRRQEQLDRYEAELHKNREGIGMSLYQLFDAYSGCRKVADMNWPIPSVCSHNAEWLRNVCDLMAQYSDFSESIGYDYKKNVWYGYIGQDSSFQTQSEIRTLLENIISALSDSLSVGHELYNKYGLETGTLDDLEKMQDLLDLLADTDIFTPQIITEEDAKKYQCEINKLYDAAQIIIAARNSINEEFDKEFYDLNGSELYKKMTRQYTGLFSRIFGSEYKNIVSQMRLLRKSGKKVSYKQAVKFTEKLDEYQAQTEIFTDIEQGIKENLGAAYGGVETDWIRIMPQVNRLGDIVNNAVHLGNISKLSKSDFEVSQGDFKKYAERIETAKRSYGKSLVDFIRMFDSEKFDWAKLSKEDLYAKCQKCLEEVEKLGNWLSFSELLKQIADYGCIGFIDCVIANNVLASDVEKCFAKAYYRQWIENIIQQSPVLAGFTRASHDQTVNAFAKKDSEQFVISKAQIKSELSAKRPALDFVANGSAVQILLREETKKRKQKSIRNLLAETAEVVQIIKPCFLMSPLSVSTFLQTDAISFDVVVFDEASQIFPQDAIGAIYRAKQAIIVGDSKQMPPSNFFNSSVDIEDDDEETGDITDFESILDLCATSMPQFRLRWHYRSHFEQLISFSNKNFYDNDLVTFPSSKDDCYEGVGIDYYHVDGVFDRKSKTNRKEADYVIERIYENIERYPNRSMGVVAFSVAQADLIDRLLTRKRQENPIHEDYFKGDVKEPFFIKNLETVQGDERDIIIFSIAYGMGSDGRLLNNFGPLNRNGGERRLNVAVSRAKDNVQVISSMHYTDIDLKGAGSNGARLLREYLDYAENGMIALQRAVSVNNYDHFDSEFEVEVHDFLVENGFSVDMQVGCSNFRIDIGLKYPGTSNYVLAIECDGATYHSSKNARDRDRLRQEILENMGWRFYRIWSTDWFKNNKVAKEKLLEAAGYALEHPMTRGESNEPSTEVSNYEHTIVTAKMAFPAYRKANTSGYSGIIFGSYNGFQTMLKSILAIEAPLSEEWLLKRICPYFGRQKVTSVVEQEYEKRMYNCSKNGIIRRKGFLYLQDTKYSLRGPSKDGETRDIKYIALEELADGILVIMKQNIRADRLGLYKMIGEQLGFSRTGPAMVERMDEAVKMLSNFIDVDGETLIYNGK